MARSNPAAPARFGDRARARPSARLARFAIDVNGALSIEFAFILPVMLLILSGTIEFCDAMGAKRRLDVAVSTLGDLPATGRNDYLHFDEVDAMMDATELMMLPYGSGDAELTLTVITYDDADDRTEVVWSLVRTDGELSENTEAGYQRGDAFTGLPEATYLAAGEAFARSDHHLVVAKIAYTHQPIIVPSYLGTLRFEETEVRLPRKEPWVHLCQDNPDSADCTDGRNWNEGLGRPD